MEAEAAPLCELLVPFLRSCKEEVLKPITGDAKGNIPTWLHGNLLRVGSGLLEVGSDRYDHVFDGLALMHKFEIRHGRVSYENRFLRSDTYRKNMEAKRIVVSEFGTPGRPDPCKTIFQRFTSLFSRDDFTDNDLVNFVKYTDQFYACSETNFIWKIDPDTLESVEKVDLRKFVLLNTASAHPLEDTDGTVYNVGHGFSAKPSYVFVKFPPKEAGESNPFQRGCVVGKIPALRNFSPSYFHSFGMTENFLIFVEQSLVMSVPKLMYAHLRRTAYADGMKWNREQKARFHVVRKDTGELLKTKYLSNPLVLFHHINAYEEDNHLVVDMCWCPDGNIVKSLYVEALKTLCSNGHRGLETLMSRARRFVLPLDVKNKKNVGQNLLSLENCEAKATLQRDGHIFCEPEPLIKDDVWSSEMPRINYQRHNGRKYRYYYSLGKTSGLEATALLKVDTETKTVLHWEEDGAIPSEPVFVDSPNSSTEDDGVILASLLYQTDLRRVTLLVLDAKDMTELGRADFQTNTSIPGDFHGIFIPSQTSEDRRNCIL